MSAPAGVETVATVLKRPRASFAGSSETAYLCDTAPAMEMVGMRRLPVMMWVSHLSTMMDPSRGDIHLHGLDAQAISGLPGLLEEPAVIMDTSWTATRTDERISRALGRFRGRLSDVRGGRDQVADMRLRAYTNV